MPMVMATSAPRLGCQVVEARGTEVYGGALLGYAKVLVKELVGMLLVIDIVKEVLLLDEELVPVEVLEELDMLVDMPPVVEFRPQTVGSTPEIASTGLKAVIGC
jgi:hypothetical protein